MDQDKYYIAVIEEYDSPVSESPWRTERQGLFKTYREASEWLIEEGFDVYSELCQLTEEYELYFEIGSYMGSESYEGYIEKWKVKYEKERLKCQISG